MYQSGHLKRPFSPKLTRVSHAPCFYYCFLASKHTRRFRANIKYPDKSIDYMIRRPLCYPDM